MSTKKIDKIKFIERHEPALDAGDYEVTLTHSLEGSTAEKTVLFSVLGDRFSIPPSHIQAVFPPAGSIGNHDNVLPHIVLTRSTLPWERNINEDDSEGDGKAPWLALLLFDETETALYTEHPNPQGGEVGADDGLTAGDLWLGHDDPYCPELHTESGQAEDDKVTVIDVDRELLQKIMPKRAELPWLGHVRHGVATEVQVSQDDFSFLADEAANEVDIWNYLLAHEYITDTGIITSTFTDEIVTPDAMAPDSELGDKLRQIYKILRAAESDTEYAMIIGNRLPQNGHTSTVFLVSLENRFEGSAGEFNYGPEGTQAVRLVVLKKWCFADVAARYNFSTVLAGVSRQVMASGRALAESDLMYYYLHTGHAPLEHQLRNGDHTVSWYRGPLVPLNEADATDITGSQEALVGARFSHSADGLVVYDHTVHMLNVSYAAAWELGRNLALRDQEFSVRLFDYKRSHYQYLKQLEAQIDHLPFDGTLATDMPAYLQDWFSRLRLLEGVPINYLLPEATYLPAESLRFFEVDGVWVEALLDGAFSIGRVSTAEGSRDQNAQTTEGHPTQFGNTVTGVLIRSEVIADYPELVVDGYQVFPVAGAEEDELAATDKLTVLREARLGHDVLLCLFDGVVKTVDVHKKPELLHFGFDHEDETGIQYTKRLRNADGTENETWNLTPEEIPFGSVTYRTLAVIDLETLIYSKLDDADFPTFTPAQFALQMIEGVEKVRFVNQTD